MIRRFDCSYYKKINIKLLMQIFDRLSEVSYDMFDVIINSFPFHEEDFYYDSGETVFYLESILQCIKNYMKDNVPVEQYVELLRFTIYILKNEECETCNLWESFYNHNKSKAHEILNSMNTHCSSLIQKNTACVLSSILRNNEDLKLKKLLDNHCCHAEITMNLHDYLASIINEREKYDEDNED